MAALIVALGPLLWLVLAVRRASYLGLGRDQGIFQGTAWSIAHGDKLYRDLREINGPVVHEIHLLAALFGGFDAHVLRSFDLAVSALVFAFVAASLPASLGTRPQPRPHLERLLWAAAGCAALLAQYVSYYSFWDLTQRESFYDWFMLAALGCDLRARSSVSPRRAGAFMLAAGALSVTPWFGKPTCALYTLMQLFLIAISERGLALPRRGQLLAFGGGMALGALAQLVFLGIFASIPDFLRSYLLENPRYYVYIWPHGVSHILSESHAAMFPLPIALALAVLALIAVGNMKRRLLGVALFPLLGIALDLLQDKAFPYHLHPVTAGAALLAVVLVCHTGTSADASAEPERRGLSLWSIGLACLLAYQGSRALLDSQSLGAEWAPKEGATAKLRKSQHYLRHFDRGDFPSSALQQAADFLQRYTRPQERIQTYGMDPYLLALAQRHSATPYIYDIDLNPEAVLEGIAKVSGSRSARDFAKAFTAAHARDMAERLKRSPPAAFVFFDNAPFTFPRSGMRDFCTHVPDAVGLLAQRYMPAERFGLLQIFMRRDLWPARKTHPPH